jgi:hypothetical protein
MIITIRRQVADILIEPPLWEAICTIEVESLKVIQMIDGVKLEVVKP